jgi:hypothetical protein
MNIGRSYRTEKPEGSSQRGPETTLSPALVCDARRRKAWCAVGTYRIRCVHKSGTRAPAGLFCLSSSAMNPPFLHVDGVSIHIRPAHRGSLQKTFERSGIGVPSCFGENHHSHHSRRMPWGLRALAVLTLLGKSQWSISNRMRPRDRRRTGFPPWPTRRTFDISASMVPSPRPS